MLSYRASITYAGGKMFYIPWNEEDLEDIEMERMTSIAIIASELIGLWETWMPF